MPPNPERQAKMAARREQMANDPVLREAADAAGEAVLSGRSRAPEAAAAAKPRQMLPSWYCKGGKVISTRRM